MIICNIIVIPNKKPRFQKEFIWRGQGYDCKWDFISNRMLLKEVKLENEAEVVEDRKVIKELEEEKEEGQWKCRRK